MAKLSLLEEIQNGAVDAKSDLGEVLRRCKLLGARLNSKSLEDWLVWESNGYPPSITLPEYRIWHIHLKGEFFGPFQSSLSNAPIPDVCVPEKFRNGYTVFRCRDSVAAIQEALKANTTGAFQTSASNLPLILGTKVYHGLNCVQAWGEFGTGQFVEVLNTVRNRVLDFVLAIAKAYPGVCDDFRDNGKIEPSRVNQIFYTTVYGGAANVVGTAGQSVLAFNVHIDDFDSLETALAAAGLTKPDLNELQKAISSDPKPKDGRSFGPGVAAWISKMVTKAATGAWDVSIQAAGALLAGTIARYYGLPE